MKLLFLICTKRKKSTKSSDFSGCCSLATVVIPESVTGVTDIGERAFYSCSGLTDVTLGNGLTSIGSETFRNCTNLTAIAIPDGVTSIANSTFSGCENLSTVTIGSGVQSIGTSAFSGCSQLKEIYCYAEETPEVESSSFRKVNVGEVLLVVPDDAVEKYKSHEIWGQFWIETPTGIDRIDDSKPKAECSAPVYSISGQRVPARQSGLNIIHFSDGTARKILVK